MFSDSRNVQKRATKSDTSGHCLPHGLSCAAGFALGDLHVYNPIAMAWTDLSIPASGTPPSPRDWQGFAAAADRLYVHGGEGESGNMSRIVMA